MRAFSVTRLGLATGVLLIHFACVEAMLTSYPMRTQMRSSAQTPVAVRLVLDTADSASYTVARVETMQTAALLTPHATLNPPKNLIPTPVQRIKSEVRSHEEPALANADLAPGTLPDLDTYLPSDTMDRRPTPMSEPDITTLEGLTTSGLPVRLRLYIDRIGKVVAVFTLEAGLLDDDFTKGLQKMFLDTAFIPGKLLGEDRASYLDIELVGR